MHCPCTHAYFLYKVMLQLHVNQPRNALLSAATQSPTGNQQNSLAHICTGTHGDWYPRPCVPFPPPDWMSPIHLCKPISKGIPEDPWFLTPASMDKAGDFSGNLYMERKTQDWTEINKREGDGEKAVRRWEPKWDCSVTSCPSPTTASATVHSILLSQTEETQTVEWSHLSIGHIKSLNCSL